ncbi:MAG: hypothetical protein HBSAPP02_29170 [Phycisphaerae bacterium]|nr:MAG: hypothetical protein HRU71_02010 [Planctomycetia bacterium]RIK68443.1 MAG: hypothetical protein DCC66_10315 [Planctomycetota bacterium]GJQ27885.1 MAG: hypothetical protein HBSAPP02_29170 [Phycisphaerae bacterium]
MPKAAFRFLFVVLCVYVGLALAWPAVGTGYRAFYRGLCNTVFYSVGGRASVTFRPLDSADEVMDTEMVLVNKALPGAFGTRPVSARYDGYIPASLVCALVVATPVSWRRRLFGLVGSMLAVHGFVLFRRWVSIVNTLSQGDAINAFHPPGWLKTVMGFLVEHVFASIVASSFVMPVFVWMIVLFRRADWERLRATAAARHASLSTTA